MHYKEVKILSNEVTMCVNGMSCGMCEASVKKAVYALAGVDKVNVELQKKLVTVKFDADKVNETAIKEAITEQGYDVE